MREGTWLLCFSMDEEGMIPLADAAVEALNLTPGDVLKVHAQGDRVILKPLKRCGGKRERL